MPDCPNAETLKRLLNDDACDETSPAIEAHLASCVRCRQTLERLTGDVLLEQVQRLGRCEHQTEARVGSVPPLLRSAEECPPRISQGLSGVGEGSLPDALPFLGPPTAKGLLGQLGCYHLVREIDRGSFGYVFQAHDEKLDRIVALKVLRPELAASIRDRVRFEREARAAAGIDSDYIVTIHDVGSVPGSTLPYLVMEYVEGESLSARLRREEPVEPMVTADLVRQAALGLAAAHERGIVHRDIKPSNILVERRSGRIKITDFGLARAIEMTEERSLQSGCLIGTPAYMSVEQINAPTRIDGRTDVYSLGVVLYELLAGERPFRGTAVSLLQQVLYDEPCPPSKLRDHVPADLETICLKCLQKDAHRRYGSAQTLAEDLQRFLEGKPILARPVSSWERALKWIRRRPLIAGLSFSVVLVAALGFAGVTWQWRQAAAALRDARTTLYFRDISIADSKWQTNQVDLAEEILDRCPTDLRQWEWHYLKRRCFIKMLHLEARAVRSITTISHDGRSLAMCDGDDTISLWDVASGRRLANFRTPADLLASLFVSPDGRFLAWVTKDKAVRVWRTRTGQEIQAGGGRLGDARIVEFSYDGRSLAKADIGGGVSLWEIESGQRLRNLVGGTQPVGFLAFSPDDRYLAGASDEKGEDGPQGEIRVWEIATGRTIFTRRKPKRHYASLAFDPRVQYLAAGSGGFDNRLDDRGEVTMWNIRTGQVCLQNNVHAPAVSSVAFSPDGRSLASASSNRTIQLWDTSNGSEVLVLRTSENTPMIVFSPDGARILAVQVDGAVAVLDRATEPGSLTYRGHHQAVFSLSFSPDGRSLASGSADKTVQLWEVASGRLLRSFSGPGGHVRGVLAVAFSPDGKQIASASRDQTLRLWNGETGEQVRTLLGHADCVTSVAFSPDGSRLASGSKDKTIRIWEATSAEELLTLRGHTVDVRGVAFSSDGTRIASASGGFVDGKGVGQGELKLWDARSGRELRDFFGHTRPVNSVSFSPDGKRLVSASDDRTIRIWDSATGEALFTLSGHAYKVTGAAFSPDGTRIASGSDDRTVKLWEAATGREILTLSERSGSNGVAFSPDGRRLASAQWDGTVKVWDATPADR